MLISGRRRQVLGPAGRKDELSTLPGAQFPRDKTRLEFIQG